MGNRSSSPSDKGPGAIVAPEAAADAKHPSKLTPVVASKVDEAKKADPAATGDSGGAYSIEGLEEEISGAFRGIAAATRKMAMAGKKAIIAKGPAMKQTVRVVGENRPLAFASEGAVAGESLMPKAVYYGAWGLSGAAVCADIYTKYDDAPEDLKNSTAAYWTCFHVPATLVVPAVIIHQVVHAVQHAVEKPKGFASRLPPRAKTLAPVAAALVSIVPVVPIVDHTAELVLEPTLGKYLGLSFEHDHGHDEKHDSSQ